MTSSTRARRTPRALRGAACLLLPCICLALPPGCPTPGEKGPAANFIASPLSGVAPLSVQFTDLSLGGDELITQWAWQFGDGGTGTDQNPVHTYTAAGSYNVSLTVTTKVGPNTLLMTGLITVTNPVPPDNSVITLPGGVLLETLFVPAGSFMMGSPDTEQDRLVIEGPRHQVALTRGFWMGTTEITKAQWQAVMGTTPWAGQSQISTDPASPAVWISWVDANDFTAALATLTGLAFRLPTEAEWEFACRAGTATRFYWGDDPNYTAIDNNAWWTGNAFNVGDQFAHVVGLKLPNPPGLFDMSGNVWEWCADWYAAYTADAATDPTGPQGGLYRMIRGGALDSSAPNCRSAYRAASAPQVITSRAGFRVVRN